jgi:hypothetical protein
MAKKGNHIIDKLVIDLNVSGIDQTQRHVLGKKLKSEVLAAIKHLDKKIGHDFDNNFYQLDRLLIDLDTPTDNLQNLDRRIGDVLFQKINSLYAGGETQPDSIQFSELAPQEHIQNLSLFFLTHGHFPWWSGNNYTLSDIVQWLHKMPADSWRKEIMPVLKANQSAVDRLILQFPEVIIKELIAKSSFTPEAFLLINDLTDFFKQGKDSISVAQIKKLKTSLYQILWRQVLAEQSIDRPNLSKATLNELVNSALVLPDQLEKWKIGLRKSKKAKAGEWLKKLDSHKIKKKKASDEVVKEDLPKKIDSNDFEVQQAGLVLVYPFVKTLFERLELLENYLFKDIAAKERAVCLLHYLATGEEIFDEPKLILPMYLCDWPIGVSIDRFLPIDDREKSECTKVLESVIKQWPTLKNTSPDGLRENFIKREGKLKKEAFGWSLYVESKTQDLLLDRIPWGFSKIKFKWMESMLTVNWN